ncbi:MAG: hypothetical protein ACI9R3_000371 [Verrucomicrobiales bacterium]|jgi:hypothetical protein
MSKRVCHDLKTERTDVLPPLPAVARILPVGFYLGIVGAAALSAFFYWQLQQAESSKAEFLAKEQTEKADEANITKKMAAIEVETKKAEEVREWVNGAKGIQLLVAQIARSMEKDSTISELRLTRENLDPSKIRTALRLNEGGSEQLEKTIKLIEEKNGYRPYEASKKGDPLKGEIDYDAILIKTASSN